MNDYIQKDELLFYFREILPDEGENELADEMYRIALNMPAVDVVPARHGELVYLPESVSVISHYRCSCCCSPVFEQDATTRYVYCPRCGAKFDGGKNEDL